MVSGGGATFGYAIRVAIALVCSTALARLPASVESFVERSTTRRLSSSRGTRSSLRRSSRSSTRRRCRSCSSTSPSCPTATTERARRSGRFLRPTGAVIPAAVGVDIGCGMIAVRTPLTRADIAAPAAVRAGIERRIPMSAGKNNAKLDRHGRRTRSHARAPGQRDPRDARPVRQELAPCAWDARAAATTSSNWPRTATAPSGSRLHSGSRGVGNKIGSHYIKVAQQLCASMGVHLPDRDLAYLPRGPSRVCRLPPRLELGAAVRAAQSQRDDGPRAGGGEARGVRRRTGTPPESGAAAHQLASQLHAGRSSTSAARVWVTRKGAIEARRSNWAMIPGSMGTRSYIVVGKEHPMSFHSAPHGAGRRYSRTKARALFSMDDLSRAMAGHRVPAFQGAARRDSRRLQGHRRSDGAREGSR